MKKIIRRIIAAVLALLMMLAAAGCSEKSSGDPLLDAGKNAAKYLYKLYEMEYGSEWLAASLGGYELGVSSSWREKYAKAVEETAAECGGVFNANKYTEQSSCIIGLTAAGYDASDFCGYDLTAPLGDYDTVLLQGLSGAAWALIALDCGNYDMPQSPDAEVQATREMYVDYILSRKLSDGGFAFSGEYADTDMTAMVLMALAPYSERADVAEAIDGGVECLMKLQNDDGGFSSCGTANAESCAQVIVALTRLGIKSDDERFVKNGTTVLDKLLTYQKKDGSFMHTDGGDSDAMSTEQALTAIVSCLRQNSGNPDIYTMK